MTTTHRTIAICTTPRSGSTLVCALMRASGVAGWPESWYRAEDRAEYVQDWGIEPDNPAAFLQGAIRAGSTPNGVFGIRLQSMSLQPMLQELAAVCGPADDMTLLQRSFGPCTFIHISRRDTVAQAVSRLKAEATQIWHLDGTEPDSPAAGTRYDADLLDTWQKEAALGNQAWDCWFTVHGVEPVRLVYEDYADDPATMVRSLLDRLGLPVPPATPLAVPNRRMADAVSARWAARFRRERGIADAL